MRVRSGLVVAALLVAGVALTGCDMNVGLSGDSTHSARSFDLSGDAVTVLVDNDVTLVRGRAGTVQVQRWLTGKARDRATWRLHGDELRVTAPCVGVNLNCEAKYQVAVPPGVKVSLSTTYGDVVANGLGNDLNVVSEHGDLSLTKLSGQIRASTDYGNVTARRLGSGDVMAESDSGDISLGFADAPTRVAARSSYGNILLTVPDSAYHVTTGTKYGEVNSQLTDNDSAKRTLVATTDNGDVTISTGDAPGGPSTDPDAGDRSGD
ncbi:DUF4097 family beta strand repeat-containing protein [Actinocatenispora sera]|uniref:DUF4097 family beta strand repeat-containing protein n=1 Tax=Actinocatenispora sera TaxID=390989 RepID=UPI00340370B0